jgi:hypothetical protein
MALLTVGSENRAPTDLCYEDHGKGKPVVLIVSIALAGRQ